MDLDQLIETEEFKKEVQNVAKAYERVGGASLDLLVQSDVSSDDILTDWSILRDYTVLFFANTLSFF